ncbi:MAG: hypothetical protein U9R56_08025 [candidate division Zixibacteria bacterium]|nr:hypothetical protein [candidate division Zixibacteria bacterium]
MRSIMKSFLTLVAIMALMGSFETSTAQGIDPGLPDTLYLDSVTAPANGSGTVPVYFTNDEFLGGVEMTLTYDSPDIHLDSFSFVGGRLEGLAVSGYMTGENDFSVYCIAFSELIPPGSGLMGTLHFGYLSTIVPQVVTIDTVTLSGNQVQYATVFSDASSVPFKPVSVKGYLDIQVSGCCIGNRGNVNNSPDDMVDITDLIYFVNYMFLQGSDIECPDEANLTADLEGVIDITDLMYLINFMFNSGPDPLPCY